MRGAIAGAGTPARIVGVFTVVPSCSSPVDIRRSEKTRGHFFPRGHWVCGRVSDSASPAAAARPATGPRATGTVAPTGTPLRLGSGLIDDQVSVAEESAIQHLNGLGGFLLRAHLHESKAARAAGELVRDDANRFHRARLREELAEVFLRSLEGEVTDEEL